MDEAENIWLKNVSMKTYHINPTLQLYDKEDIRSNSVAINNGYFLFCVFTIKQPNRIGQYILILPQDICVSYIVKLTKGKNTPTIQVLSNAIKQNYCKNIKRDKCRLSEDINNRHGKHL